MMKCDKCSDYKEGICNRKRGAMELECLVRCLLCVTTDMYELLSEDIDEGEGWKYD